MSAISAWATQIVLLILLAMILEMLLPNESFQRYVKMVIGLVLIVALLNPVMKLFHMDTNKILEDFSLTDNNDLIKNSINMNKTEIETSQRAYILKQMAVPMKKLVKEELKERYDLAIKDLNIELDDSNSDELPIKKVIVTLGKATTADDEKSGVQPVAKVKDINIRVGDDSKDSETQMNKVARQEIIQLLSDKWQIPTSKLSVFMEGGDH